MQAVRAEQELVAGENFEVDGVGLDGLVDADRASDRVFVLLVRGGLEPLLGDAAALDELVDQRVVLGQLDHLPGAQHVDPAVADVGDERAVAGDQHGRAGGPHPALLRLGDPLVIDGLAGGLDGVLQHRQDLGRRGLAVPLGVVLEQLTPRVSGVPELVHGQLGGHLARGMPAHPVGHHEERQLLVDEEVVLVRLALLPYVGGGPEG